MSFDGLLKDTCVIFGRVAGTDDTGWPNGAWTDEIETVKCRVNQQELAGAIYYRNDSGQQEVPEIIMFMREPITVTLDAKNHQVQWRGQMWRILRASQLDGYGAKHHLEVELKTVGTRSP
jgi:hypothetical protein